MGQIPYYALPPIYVRRCVDTQTWRDQPSLAQGTVAIIIRLEQRLNKAMRLYRKSGRQLEAAWMDAEAADDRLSYRDAPEPEHGSVAERLMARADAVGERDARLRFMVESLRFQLGLKPLG